MSLPKLKKLRPPLVIRRVVGHSMLPVLPPGTLVIGFGWLRQPKMEAVVILEHEGKEKIKRITDIRGEEIYVVGDHDNGSTDSRHFGWVDNSLIKARVIWPRTKTVSTS